MTDDDETPRSDEATPARRTAAHGTSGRGTPARPAAVVVGGGIAGVTSALALADAGLDVTLLEGRPRLGGLAFSFRRGDLTVDNGQHVYLRCCTAYQWFLDRVGARALAPLQERLDIPVLDPGPAGDAPSAPSAPGAIPSGAPSAPAVTGASSRGPRLGRLRRTALPVPLHLAKSLATYPHLSLAERARVGSVALALGRLDPADPALDAQDFGSWLARHGQSRRAIRAVWDLVGVATLNARAGDASLGLAAKVFRTGLLSAPGAADIGWARVPLGDIHDRLARRALDSAGVRTEVRARVTSVARSTPAPDDARGAHGQWTVQVPGERIEADVVVLATAQREAHALLPAGALPDSNRLLAIGTAPILNVHVVYDRRVLARPFFATIGSPVQWVFDRTDTSGLTGGQYLALSQSAAHDEIDEPVDTLRKRYLPELERLLPAARGAEVRDFFVTRERTATFAPVPGVGALRPGHRTRAPGLYLAGSWTDTGWPATMESAVRSGAGAARAALDALGRRPVRLFEEAA